ncbi:MAG: FAD:protein FMN transferase [Barnesiella sp.]|nr:FAD:protein FMN transferase [Barnesiella sp.]
MINKIFLPTIVGLFILAGCGGRGESYRSCSGSVWATTYNITYCSSKDLSDSILTVMKQVEHSLSPFDSLSVISRINRGESPAIDTLLSRVFLASQKVNRLSGGAFDPTVAPLVNLWGFGYKDGGGSPTDAQIDSALMRVGIDRCRIERNHIVKCHPATEFNFSAITKGYGSDLVGEMLHRNGVESYMVEIGGEIALRGVNPDGEDWHIQIDAPVEGVMSFQHHALSVIALTDCGIATSGNYRNYRQTSQGRAWHTIDPKSGRPAQSEILSATVIAPSCMEADAFATACMAMPMEKALDMIDGCSGVEAMFVLSPEGKDNMFRVVYSSGWDTINSHK